jgi:hypothetical protein
MKNSDVILKRQKVRIRFKNEDMDFMLNWVLGIGEIIGFSHVEQEAIEAGLRSSDAFTLRRCQILLASSRGQRPAIIARNLGCVTQIVHTAIHAFEDKGVACLKQESSRPKTVQAQFDQA